VRGEMVENKIRGAMEECILCPRECHVDRWLGNRGYCGQTAQIRAARAALHMWEEPCISGKAGSGTVFFSGCQVRCVFCQNREIAVGEAGKEITIERLAEIFLELQAKGANNINLVTPTHFVPQIAETLRQAKAKGLTLPVVYNTSSYEKVETLRMMEGLVDIYLPDLKYKNSELSNRYSHAADYFEQATQAIAEMVRQVGEPVFMERACTSQKDEAGELPEPEMLLQRGVIVRHLVLPGQVEDSKAVIRYLYETYGDQIYISIMNQYTPLAGVTDYQEINRKLTEEEYDEVVDYAIELGVENGFIQEGETAEESFIPAFDLQGI